MDTKFKYIIDTDAGERIIREGKAPDVIVPQGITEKFLPGSFIDLVNKKTFNPTSTLVKYDIPAGSVTIETNIQSVTQIGIDKYKAAYEYSQKIKTFQINTDHMWGLKALGDHIKMNRNMFPDSEQALQLAAQFKTLTATVNQKIEKHKDDRANSLERFEQEVQSNIPDFFIMETPIIQGEANPSRFKVDVNFHVRGKEVEVFLTSFELQETFESEVKTKIEKILKHITEKQPDLIILQMQ